MTTEVIIANRGPRKIKVELQGKDEKGRFYQASECTLENGGFNTFNVHQHQSLQIIELDPVVEEATKL